VAIGDGTGVRRTYIDWARGIAVLLMIEAHTTDAWTRAAAKSTVAFRNATVLGGFAAPLFLWVAGLVAMLTAARIAERVGRRAAVLAVARRGVEIFLLAFLFRLQAFVVSPGGPAVSLLRVDILNIMGPALVLAAALWGLGSTTTARVLLFAVAAASTAMVTPIVRAALWIDALPQWVQWYLRPSGAHTTFTAFPWIGFVFAGAALGTLLTVPRVDDERRRLIAVGACGVLLIALGLVTASQPTIYRASSFWTSSPTWFSIRVGVLMLLLSALFAVARLTGDAFAWQRALALVGRSSLFIYWIHVELVYGYASWLWRGRLPLWGTAVGAMLFTVLMYFAVLVRDRVLVQAPVLRRRQTVPIRPANGVYSRS
jgi:uncharacterized membrane protein